VHIAVHVTQLICLSSFSICIFISLIPANVYLNMYTHFPPLPYSYTLIAIFTTFCVWSRYDLYLYCFQITWRALTPSKRAVLCNVIILHVVLSHGYFFHARLISRVHGSFLTWLPRLPISFLCLTVTCSTSLGICSGIQLSFVGSCCFTSWHPSAHTHRESRSSCFFFPENFILNVQYQPYVLTTNGCGDYRRIQGGEDS